VTGFVRTVLGDVDAASLGATYVHEHLILDNALIATDYPHIHLPSVEDAAKEVGDCAAVGVGCMVDAMPASGGRHPDRLAAISGLTGVAIVATTGLHTPKYYLHHPWAVDASPEVLAELFAADVDIGIDRFDYTGPVVERTEHRAGVIKVATDAEGLTDRARRVFEGAVEAARRTGAPILTHCEDGLDGMAHVDCFDDLGFPLDRVVLSHTDKVEDAGYHRDLLATGVNLEYDQALRRPLDTSNRTVQLTAEAVDAGYASKVMFGTDGARRTLWRSLGGAPGLAWMRTGFIAALGSLGVGDDVIEAMFETNPQRFLTLGTSP
jgi:phosphotriesterase-related protein